MPDTPTADDLARALALVDGHVFGESVLVGIDAGIARAVFAVARAAVADAEAWRALYDPGRRGDVRVMDSAIDASGDALDAAIADLVRLATGAQGGEA